MRAAVARLVLTALALVPYWPLLTFNRIYVTDDFFTSDIFNGELPGRVLIGALMRDGQLPLWTSNLCSGLPLAGAYGEPLGLAFFALLPPAAALDGFVVLLLLIGAHGAYSLARRFGADTAGAVLAGLAFSGSGYFAGQLKHLSIVATVVWLPWGLLLLDRSFRPQGPSWAARVRDVGLFGLVFAEQLLAGFPQSAYICGIVYLGFVGFRIARGHLAQGRRGDGARLTALTCFATFLAVLAAGVVLLPLAELASLSDREQSAGWGWATVWPYWPGNALTFLFPYINGDVSNNSYLRPSLFWEDYGYLGVAPFLLGIYGAVRMWSTDTTRFLVVMTAAAYLMVLGPTSIVYQAAYHVVPGVSMFRFPTRFLVVVDLGLSLLAGVGLTRLRTWACRRSTPSRTGRAAALAWGVCLFTTADLLFHQPRQNPMVSADRWLAEPASVRRIRASTPAPRTYTPNHSLLHNLAFREARGWSDLTPYFDLRAILQPNTGGGYWGIPSADCYTGVAPRWYVDLWGDHNRPGLMTTLTTPDARQRLIRAHPSLAGVLSANGVTHVLSPFPVVGTTMATLDDDRPFVYVVGGAARVRVVPRARVATSSREAAAWMVDTSFDAGREVILHDVAVDAGLTATPGEVWSAGAARALVVAESPTRLAIDTASKDDGFLVVSDTFYPGWTATIDGVPVRIYRANIAARAVPLPKGTHRVEFTFDAPTFYRGLMLTGFGLALLGLWTLGAGLRARRATRSSGADGIRGGHVDATALRPRRSGEELDEQQVKAFVGRRAAAPRSAVGTRSPPPTAD